MKKRSIFALFMMVLCLLCVFTLAACDEEPELPDNGGGNDAPNTELTPGGGETPGGQTPHAHAYGAWEVTTSATCGVAGVETRICTCGWSETRSIAATSDHIYNTSNVCTVCHTPLQYTEGLAYTLNTEETAYTVTGMGTATSTDIVIPPYYEGLPVTNIGHRAFYDREMLTSITIPESVTSIGFMAFYGCMGVIQTENGVSYVDRWVVDCDANVATTTLREDTIGIGHSAFYNRDNLTAISLPTSVKNIGENAFKSCDSLTVITIPSNVINIGEEAFSKCKNLTDITISSNMTNIGVAAFASCERLTSVTLPEGMTYISNECFCECYNLTTISIPSSVISIGDGAFAESVKLSTVSFGHNSQLVSIGNNAFVGCALASITIPASVTSIGKRAFYACSSLASITVESGNTVYHSVGNCLIETTSKTLVVGCKNSVIPADGSVTSIGNSAFYSCDNLTSITLPATVITIGSNAFHGCSGLISITIPASVTSIGSSAFYGCHSLTTVYYTGSASDWSNISIDSTNSKLTSATRYYYSTTQPTVAGNWWYYDNDGKPAVWPAVEG